MAIKDPMLPTFDVILLREWNDAYRRTTVRRIVTPRKTSVMIVNAGTKTTAWFLKFRFPMKTAVEFI
jgi:hypothetical protein